jgi:CO/xanthine dehydrogenase Mo-binding subunit
MKDSENISKAVKRSDFDDKIGGQAQYCADLRYGQMLYAKTLRSEKARARIISVETPPLPAGYCIVDYRDIPGRNIVPIIHDDQPFLAQDRVNYIGEPILLVVGPDKQLILDLLSEIRVNYEELKPVMDIAQAEAPQEEYIFKNKPCFVEYAYRKGNLEKAIENSRFFVEDEFCTGYQEQAYLETQAVIAVYEEERLTVRGSIQCPYYLMDALKQALGWPQERIRVIQLPTGGGFGGKEDYPMLLAVHAALAAIKTKKPVQLVLDRQEDIICSTKRHPAVIRIRSYLDEHNNIIGREIDIKTDAGAYAGLSSVVLQRMMFSAGGVYNIENLKVQAKAYATNKVVSGAFRGFGGPQALFAIEMHMENIARKLNLDSLELKRKYFLRQGDTSSTGGLFQYDIKLAEIAAEIDNISGYSRKRRLLSVNNASLRGIGCSVFFHGCGFTGSNEQDEIKPRVLLKKYRENSVQIFVSSTEIGQGAQTTLRKIVAHTLEIPLEQVKLDYPDTDFCPDSGPTVASRTVLIVGKLLHDCALKMKERWSEEETEIFQEFQYPEDMSWDNEKFQGDAYHDYSWGANVIEVEIDPLTYAIDILGIWAVYDVGTPIDEKIVRGQIEGGIVQGLGYGGLEVLTAEKGRLRQNNFASYMIPTALDVPEIVSKLVWNPNDKGPFGARGLGELALIGVAPALALAVQNALGCQVKQIPLTPEYIMELMHNA